MPTAKDPDKQDFYVYRITADGVPFYIGIGRSGRARMRVGFVRNQMRREMSGQVAKWSLSNRVVAGLLASNRQIEIEYPHMALSRVEALSRERAEIATQLALGNVLANIQHNPVAPKSADEVVMAVAAAIAAHRFAQTKSSNSPATSLANLGGSDPSAKAALRRRPPLS